MNQTIDLAGAVAYLKACDNAIILMHKSPDGDTLGCGHALLAALRTLGKTAKAVCSSPISPRYAYMTDRWFPAPEFEPACYISVDTADRPLLGPEYAETPIDLCLDHHGSNSHYAKRVLCDPSNASCAELIIQIIDGLGVPVDKYIAECLYTGLTSDTGCFRYANTTANSLRVGARLIEVGIDSLSLNNLLFEVKSKPRFELEKLAIATIELTMGGRVAFMTITQDMLEETGIDNGDIEGITAIPRNIDGVEIGITLRQLRNGNYKVSLRTATINAAEIAAKFGGGGHPRASGFECSGSPFDIKVMIVAILEKLLP